MRAKAKVIEDSKLPHAKSVAVKRFNLSLQLSVLQHEVMKPSVTEESLATKLCKVFEIPRGYSILGQASISVAPKDTQTSPTLTRAHY